MTTKEADTIRSIFGDATSEDVDSNIASIFGKSTGPIDNKVLLASKKRTVLPRKTKTEDVSNDKEEQEEKEEPPKKKSKKANDEENADLESNYMTKLLAEESEEEEEEEQKEEEETKKVKSAPAKTFDLKKDELEKAESTIFIGNLSTKIINDKKLNKELKKLFEQFGKIKSIRFRSISFNDNLPRKVAFIQKKINETNDAANAYIVFEQKLDSLKATSLNGTIFHNHHLRVDHLTHPLKEDNKRSIFIGNLDFQEKEENLWNFFEEKIGKGELENVRIIRDSKTNFGKGFAIVQFKDFANVNKLLLLNDKPLTTSDKQRKLRITRCKKTDKKSSTTGNKNLSQKERTIVGRGKKILNKSDRNTIGRKRVVIEGDRAHKGDRVKGIKNGLGKVKKPRIRDRSTKFKNDMKLKK